MGFWHQRNRGLAVRLAGTVCVATILLHSGPLGAVQLGDGSTVFTSPPRLTDFSTFVTYAHERNPTYYITVNLLPEAGVALETLTVSLM
ncbi:MAG: hypothetical protein AAGD25_40725 [Cyanobacteria bacterium P01_F01_bin.150]